MRRGIWQDISIPGVLHVCAKCDGEQEASTDYYPRKPHGRQQCVTAPNIPEIAQPTVARSATEGLASYGITSAEQPFVQRHCAETRQEGCRFKNLRAAISLDTLLSSPTRAGKDQSKVRIRRVPPKLGTELAELLTDIAGLPVRISLLIKDLPAEMRSDLLSGGNDIHSLFSSTLER
jgi:hypothetical protein